MFEIFTEGFTFLNLLSIIAFFTTVGLFFCGIPICRQIWKRKDTDEISGAPFLMGIVGGSCWMAYGYLKGDNTVIVVTTCQVILYTTYTIFYWIMTKKKLWITLKVLAVVALVSSLFTLVHVFGHKVFHPLGIICMTLNAADFAAPLAGLQVVIRRRATSTLPLPLCIANFMVSTEWFLYGLLKWDFYLITPNGIGSFLALIQLMLFLVLPRKPGQRSPIVRLVHWTCRRDSVTTAEDLPSYYISPQILVEEIDDDKKKTTLPEKIAQKATETVSNMVEGLENVIHMVGNDQFAYVQKIDEEDSTSEKTCDSEVPSRKSTAVAPEADLKRMASVRPTISPSAPALRRTLSSPQIV